VLFSSEPVAKAMNEKFEPVWVSVRDVPVVTIDFGGGHTLTRTLNGNVATYALHPDGTVLDILPGIYSPDEYATQLDQLALLYQYAYTGFQPKSAARLAEYHATQAKRLADGQGPGRLQMDAASTFSKGRIESPVKLVIAGQPPSAGANTNPASPAQIAGQQYQQAAVPTPTNGSKAATTLRGWKEMVEDTRINETLHRKLIHEHLAKAGAVRPKDVTRWLYKQVLHADLDDPYLGLGEVLNKNYPFADEDKPAARTKP
jgi:hypothetical protein